jgi:chitinase
MRKVRTATVSLVVLMLLGWLSPAPAASARGSADTQPPTTPTNLRVTDTTANTVRLAWDPSTDDSGSVRYRLRQDTYIVFDGTLTETQAFVCCIAFGGATFEVRAEDASGNVSAWSEPVVARTDPPDTTPPSAPTNLRVTGTTSSSVSLAWNASTDNPGGEGVLGYWVQWSGGTNHGTGATSYTWPVLAPGTHSFTVVAYDAAYPAGNTSAPSNEVTVTIG